MSKKSKQEKFNFADMEFDEIEKWEKQTNSIVLFDDNLGGIAFQKSKFEGDDEPILVLMIDGKTRPFFVLGIEITNLKQFLNKNF